MNRRIHNIGKKLTLVLLAMAILGLFKVDNVRAQCTGGSLSAIAWNAPSSSNQTAILQVSYYKTFSATGGITYQFSLCSADGGSLATSFDPIMTILDNAGVPARGGYNDDFCSTTPKLVWTATSTGTYRLLLGEYSGGNCTIANTSNYGTMSYIIPSTGTATEPYEGPSNFVSSSVTTTSFSYSFDEPTITPSGYLHLRKAGSAPTFVPVDGTVYASGSTVDGGTTLVQYADEYPYGGSSSLTAGTTYYYAIYSFNGSGAFRNYLTSDALTASVTTAGSGSSAPTVTTTSASSVTTTTASAGGNVTSDGGAAVTARGVVWSTSTLPTIALSTKTSNGTGTGSFTSSITGLASGTNYYLRAYATNSVGTSYGSQLTFTTTSAMAIEPTAQPTNLMFSNIQLTSFTLSFTAASGSPDGYIGIANSAGSPTFLPIDGTAYSNGQSVGSSGDFVSFSSSSTSLNVTGATQSTTLNYKIYSYNGSGTARNYLITGTPASGSVTTLSPDSNPPTIVDNTPSTIVKGSPINISVTITDASGISYVSVDYGKVESVVDIFDYLDSNVKYVDLSNTTGNTYTGTIPASNVGDMGVIYYIYAYDIYDNLAYTNPKTITISMEGNGVTIPYSNPGTSQSNYKIVSVPIVLAKKTVNDVFGDDLGEYGDKESWRMFRYQGGKNTELTGTSTIDAGKGYWLISSKAATIDSGPGTTFNGSFDSPATLSVSAGWNQVGNPYPFDVNWSAVKGANSSLSPGDLRTFSNGSFVNGSSLKVGEGGFVMIQGSGTFKFPIIKGATSGRGGNDSVVKENQIDSDDWEVLFKLRNGTLINDLGGIGMRKDAEIMNDRYDDFTLPRFFEYLELNHHKSFINIPISKDVVPVQGNYIWEFSVESNVSDEIVEINWDNTYFGNNNKQLVLWDESRQLAIDMRKTTSYQFNKKQSSDFKVYFGDDTYINESISTDGLVFHDVFPNPARQKATFAFSLPRSTDEHTISLEIYDMMGKKIGTVIDGKYPAGYHEVSWEIHTSQSVTDGMYLARLKEGFVMKTKKFIVQQ